MANNIYNPHQMRKIPWTNGTSADVASGQVVVVGQILCVALEAIADGAAGTVGTNCGVLVPKVSAAVWNQGDELTFDISAATGVGEFDDKAAVAAAGDITGAAAVAETAGVNTQVLARVWLTGVPGVIETG